MPTRYQSLELQKSRKGSDVLLWTYIIISNITHYDRTLSNSEGCWHVCFWIKLIVDLLYRIKGGYKELLLMQVTSPLLYCRPTKSSFLPSLQDRYICHASPKKRGRCYKGTISKFIKHRLSAAQKEYRAERMPETPCENAPKK